MYKELIPVYALYLVGLLSPGPDFAVVLKNSFEAQKKALFSALGIVCGLFFHITFSILGLGIIFLKFPFLSVFIQTLGALYLGFLGVKILLPQVQTSEQNIKALPQLSKRAGFKEGFLTNILNPKAGMFLMSLFAQMINSGKIWQSQALLGVMILISSGLWFSSVALFLNIKRIRQHFLQHVPTIEKVTGAMLVLFALLILKKLFLS